MKSNSDQVIKGAVYFSLTLTGNYSFIQTDVGRRMVVEAECKCGVIKNYPLRYLKSGNTKSCGCERRENLLQSKLKHGLSKHPLYTVYQDIQRRCYNEKCGAFKDYGARGIVCKWQDLKTFIDWGMANGYKEGLEIDRKDVNGNYCPENCRFVTRAIGNTNTRRTRQISAFGESKTAAEWSRDERCLVSEKTISERIKSGKWSAEDAITKPSNDRKKETCRSSNSARMITAFGETKSIISWSEDKRCKVGYNGLKKRLYKGMEPETAISSF